ncbi:SDR family NAD(P)-dependent oxidoreductase [Luteimonas panaciterrae]|uniref:SDR family NAD(P)-dependent oxidoreductase n=1 Tax=Luteimonas panaciterrae TaxID=363885 RepID=UPI001CFAE562|nr:SDR family NAD(P)-dependent oxidoreductase [Luteimonas panaciterrae]
MTDYQKPLGSGFGAHTTAADVLSGLDLTGKRAIVTGGHSGLGFETTKALTAAGAEVIVAARDTAAAQAATRDIAGASVEALDLSDLSSVHAFAERILTTGRHIDLLINNAGIMACPETRVGPGWEAQFATNHLGHFALTQHLWPALEGSARVVSVSSAGHRLSPIRWDDMDFSQGYDKWLAYGQSKTANALFAAHLDRLGQSSGVRAFSLHPGAIFTPLQRHLSREEMIALGWMDANDQPLIPFKSPEQGAATQVWAATSSQLDGLGGLYCEDCDVAARADETDISQSFVGVKRHAVDAREAERLWALSAELTGVDAFSR